jgi:hypothetical protein
VSQPFHFTSVVELPEMLGRRARDEQELLELLEDVALDSIYYHTAARFLRHEVVEASFPNDFASWAAREVRDQVLGERLGAIDPFDSPTLEALRHELVTTLDDHLARITVVPRVIHGEPFHFMRSRLIAVPTGFAARDLGEFERCLESVDASSIYWHTVEARMRRNTPRGDFTQWVVDQCGRPELGDAMARLSPFASSLEGMRRDLLALVRRARGEPATKQRTVAEEKAA